MKREIKDLLMDLPLFKGLDPEHLELMSQCGKNVVFQAGEDLIREGEPADQFYIIRGGKVSIAIQSPGRQPLAIQTLDEGDVIGWSWLVPPYKWYFNATALSLVRAVDLDAACLRGKCENDPVLGYALMKRVVEVMFERLQATRLQLLDLYGDQLKP